MINREMCFANELHRNGHEVSILSYFKPTSKVDDGISVSYVYPTRYIGQLYSHFLSLPYAFLKIFLVLMLKRPKIVMVDLPREAYWAYKFRGLFNYKVVFTYHGVANEDFYTGELAESLRQLRKFGHEMLKKADKVFVVSNFLKDEVESLNVSCSTLYNGVDSARFQIKESTHKDKDKLLFIGRFTEYKGAFNLIKSFAKIADQAPSATMDMYGYLESEDYLAEIRSFITENRLGDRIKIAGEIDQVKASKLMQEYGIFVNGSIDETFCMPLLEAQASGTPCIAFAAGGIPEVVADQKTGLLAEPENIEQMSKNMLQLLTDDDFYESLCKGTVQHVESFYYQNLVKQLVAELSCSSMKGEMK